MIQSTRHKGLNRLYQHNDSRGVIQEHREKLVDILARLDAAGTAQDMNVPGLRLHALTNDLRGFWAVTVRANWRIIFRFANGHAWDVDYVDYH